MLNGWNVEVIWKWRSQNILVIFCRRAFRTGVVNFRRICRQFLSCKFPTYFLQCSVQSMSIDRANEEIAKHWSTSMFYCFCYEKVVLWYDWFNDSANVLQVARADPLSVRWLPAARGEVPQGAVDAGRTSDGRPLYACRVFDGDLVHDGWHRFEMTAGVVSRKPPAVLSSNK